LCHFATFWKEAAKVTTFFHLCKGGGSFPLPLPEKNPFSAHVFSQKVAFLIGTYLGGMALPAAQTLFM
jgi:hypothetical protein